MNPLIQSLLTQLQTKNPQGYSFINEMMKNGGNPNAFAKQLLSRGTPEQRQKLLNQARGYGVPNDILSQFQNIK